MTKAGKCSDFTSFFPCNGILQEPVTQMHYSVRPADSKSLRQLIEKNISSIFCVCPLVHTHFFSPLLLFLFQYIVFPKHSLTTSLFFIFTDYLLLYLTSIFISMFSLDLVFFNNFQAFAFTNTYIYSQFTSQETYKMKKKA